MPVQSQSHYKKPYKVSWTDKQTGKEHTKAFRWTNTARQEFECRKNCQNSIDVFFTIEGSELVVGIEPDDLYDDYFDDD